MKLFIVLENSYPSVRGISFHRNEKPILLFLLMYVQGAPEKPDYLKNDAAHAIFEIDQHFFFLFFFKKRNRDLF